MGIVNCEHCGKSIGHASLRRHQKSRTCLIAQGKLLESEHTCDWCGDGFHRADILKAHVSRCKQRTKALYTSTEDRLREENRSLRDQLKDNEKRVKLSESMYDALVTESKHAIELLEKEISILKAYPPTVNITNTIKIDKFIVQQYAKEHFTALTDGMLKECLSVTVDPRLLLRGPGAVAQLILETSLQGRDKLACTDTSRAICLWKDIDHTVITDKKMRKLMPKLVRPIYSAYSVAWRKNDHMGTDEYRDVGEVVHRLNMISKGKDSTSKYYNAVSRIIMDANCDLMYMLDDDDGRNHDDEGNTTEYMSSDSD